MKTKNEIVKFDTIDAYNKSVGLVTRHPLVAVIDLKESKKPIYPGKFDYGIYAIFLKKGVQCAIRYGQQSCDYREGSVVTFAPGQLIEVVGDKPNIAPDVIGLLFHPDIAFGTPLAESLKNYTFFDYSQTEALHISESERDIFNDCLARISAELDHPVDHHSASLLSVNIQVLLEYLHRFYDRQFITRHKINSGVVKNFEAQLKEYYDNGAVVDGIPSVAYFADRANLSAGYFGDLIKKETGVSPKDMITLHILNLAKQRLVSTDDDINIIAYDLGFGYPAHFTRMFKRATGQSPTSYRHTMQSLN